MKNIPVAILMFFTLFTLTYPHEPIAQSSQALEVLSNLQQCVGRVSTRFRGDNKGGRLARDINKTVNGLIERWEGAENQELPKEYLLTLKANCELLKQASMGEDEDNAVILLQDIYDDLDVKLRHARRIVGAAGTLGASVKVTVKTRRDAKEIGGYLVRCNLRRYSAQQSAMFVFNNPTSPTEGTLPPGNFVMWLEKQDGTKVISRDITIGGNGETTETIIFDVP